MKRSQMVKLIHTRLDPFVTISACDELLKMLEDLGMQPPWYTYEFGRDDKNKISNVRIPTCGGKYSINEWEDEND